MKLAVIGMTICAIGLAACAPSAERQRLDQAAAHVIVTGTERIPGHEYQVLGVADVSGDTVYESCANPQVLVRAALQRYGDIDAIVNYRKTKGTCDETALGNVCWDACEGTAVRFTRN